MVFISQTHLPQVGAEIKVTSSMLPQNKIRGVEATVASKVFLVYHVFGLPLARNAHAGNHIKLQS